MEHHAKKKKQNNGNLPVSLLVDAKLAQKAQMFLDDHQKLSVGDSVSLCAGNASDDDFDFGEPVFPLDDSSENDNGLADL